MPALTPPSAPLYPTPTESARLLGVLIGSAPKLVLPYTAPVLRALVGKLRAASAGAAATPSATSLPKAPTAKGSSQGERDGEWVGRAGPLPGATMVVGRQHAA